MDFQPEIWPVRFWRLFLFAVAIRGENQRKVVVLRSRYAAMELCTAARRMLRYSTTAAAALMLVVGLLILCGNDSVFQRLVL